MATHQFAQHGGHRGAPHHGVGVAAIGAEGIVVGSHGGAETGGDGLLADREVAGPLDQVLQEKVVGAGLEMANLELQAVHL